MSQIVDSLQAKTWFSRKRKIDKNIMKDYKSISFHARHKISQAIKNGETECYVDYSSNWTKLKNDFHYLDKVGIFVFVDITNKNRLQLSWKYNLNNLGLNQVPPVKKDELYEVNYKVFEKDGGVTFLLKEFHNSWVKFKKSLQHKKK